MATINIVTIPNEGFSIQRDNESIFNFLRLGKWWSVPLTGNINLLENIIGANTYIFNYTDTIIADGNPVTGTFSQIVAYLGDNYFNAAISGGGGGAGTSGYSGKSGYSGYSGVGSSGKSGYSGYSGTGISGYSGYSGTATSGYSGFSGAPSSSGYSGYSGESASSSGYSGYSGKSGYSGFSGSGISGYSGYSGAGSSGYSGFSGANTSGYSGYSGATSTSGYSGYSGLSGYSGFSGISGYSGFSGKSGYSGFSGTGTSGYSGYSGVGFPAQQVYTSGATVTISNQASDIWLLVNPATTISALTITMPAAPLDGQRVEISFGGTLTSGTVITALTISPNTAQTLLQPPGSVPNYGDIGQLISYRYKSSSAIWYMLLTNNYLTT